MYFGCAETDDYAPKEMVDGLENYLSGTNVDFRIEWYPGTEHGFVFPKRGDKYHKKSGNEWGQSKIYLHCICCCNRGRINFTLTP